jgi:NAD(P)-dependent dehydrogenase (short-subunit alcohol dehydrogenase family)
MPKNLTIRIFKMTIQEYPVWFITGCSSGFGWELSRAVLERQWRLVATARDPAKLAGLVAGHADRTMVAALDVTKPAAIRTAIAQTMERFGRIDVLVNNAGYSYASSIEEGEDVRIRTMFDTNVFGLAEVIRQTLPIMRAQRSGHIINISSMAGIAGNPGTGYYAATKSAVEGLSDALAKEVEPLGIKVLVVEPGPFETGFTAAMVYGDSMIDDYATTATARMKAITASVGTRPGDPQRAASAIIAAVTAEMPPQRLLLGRTALRNARGKIAAMTADFDAWETVTLEADFPQYRGT